MKMRNLLMSGIICLTTTLTALAAFTPPTTDQINAAAGDPAQLTALLSGATLEQAADVVQSVIAKAAALGLSAEELEARIGQIISKALAAVPATGHAEFATLLGKEMGDCLALRTQPAVISAVQAALAANAGTAGEAVAKAFGDSFLIATSAKGPNGVKPPPSKLYPGQN